MVYLLSFSFASFLPFLFVFSPFLPLFPPCRTSPNRTSPNLSLFSHELAGAHICESGNVCVHICAHMHVREWTGTCLYVCLCQEQIKGLGHMAATAGRTLPGIWVLRVNRIAGAQDRHPIKINVSSAHF